MHYFLWFSNIWYFFFDSILMLEKQSITSCNSAFRMLWNPLWGPSRKPLVTFKVPLSGFFVLVYNSVFWSPFLDSRFPDTKDYGNKDKSLDSYSKGTGIWVQAKAQPPVLCCERLQKCHLCLFHQAKGQVIPFPKALQDKKYSSV